MHRRIVPAILGLMVSAIIAGSFMPYPAKIWFGTPLRDVVIRMPGRLIHLNMHRIVHIAAFGIAALLAISLAHSWPRRITAALLVCALALLSETGEAMIYHNRMEWLDMIDDTLGIGAGLLLSTLWRLRAGTSNPAASER